MYFTFGIEDSFNNRAEPGYVVDVISEQLYLNKDYQTIQQFQDLHASTRISGNRHVVGQVRLEPTLGSESWGRIFEVALGHRVRVDNMRFKKHPNGLRPLFGYLDGSNLATDSTNFTINEMSSGEFDGTNYLLIGGEIILAECSSGSAVISSRAQFDTTNSIHYTYDNIYCLEVDEDRSIDICESKVDQYNAPIHDKSMTLYLYRGSDYYCYTGCKIDQLDINFNPTEPLSINFSFIGADSTNFTPITPITTYDDNDIIGDIEVFDKNVMQALRLLYVNINNTFNKDSFGFSGVLSGIPISKQNMYGQITWLYQDEQHYLDFVNNARHNLSIQMLDLTTPTITKGIIFNSNDMRLNTFSPQYTSGIVIQDSAPFYCYKGAQIYLQY